MRTQRQRQRVHNLLKSSRVNSCANFKVNAKLCKNGRRKSPARPKRVTCSRAATGNYCLLLFLFPHVPLQQITHAQFQCYLNATGVFLFPPPTPFSKKKKKNSRKTESQPVQTDEVRLQPAVLRNQKKPWSARPSYRQMKLIYLGALARCTGSAARETLSAQAHTNSHNTQFHKKGMRERQERETSRTPRADMLCM